MATILAVDDHGPTRELLRALLQYKGHRVLLAASGPDAIVIAVEKKPDLILTDVVMPGMDGYSFVHALRRHTSCGDIPVVFMSASLDEAQARALGRQCGALDYLAKPFEPAALLEIAEAALARHGI